MYIVCNIGFCVSYHHAKFELQTQHVLEKQKS
jgi:hypothetical protein